MKSPAAARSPLLLMALTVLIDFTGFGLIIPLLPFWAQHLGASTFVIGLIFVAYTIMQVIGTPILGSLSDRYGRRPIILISLTVEAFSFILTALATSLPILFLARAIGGLGASNIGSAQAVVADTTEPKDRARSMGMIGAAIGLGFVLGPALGGGLSAISTALPFWVAAALAFINAILVARFLPETRQMHSTTSKKTTRFDFSVLHIPSIANLIIVNLLFTMAFSGMEAVYALFTQHVFGWKSVQNGYLFTYVGILVVVMQGGLIGQLSKRFKPQYIMYAGLLILTTGLLMIPVSLNLATVLASLGLISIGEGAVTPIVSSMLSTLSPREKQGTILGLSQGIGSIGRIVGPLLATTLFGATSAGVPFVVSAAITFAAFIVFLPMLRVNVVQTEAAVNSHV